MPIEIHVDFETRSERNLSDCGLDLYSTDKSTQVILAAYAFGTEEPKIWEPFKSSIPKELEDAFYNPEVIIHSWNAQFERIITRWVLDIEIPINRWRCSMVQAKALSLPGSLEECGQKLNLNYNQAKLDIGKELIKKFCLPAKEGGQETLFGTSQPVFRDWDSDSNDWELFKSYCKQDVIAEREILNRMAKFPLPDREWNLWFLDQKINDTGIPCDMVLVPNAAGMAATIHQELDQRLKAITKLENPNSRDQMLEWARGQGYPFNVLGKSFVSLALKGKYDLTPECREALTIRQQSAKTFDSKFETIQRVVGSDGNLRYQFNFMGAARTARWSGHEVQPQNLTRPNKELEKRIDEAVKLIRTNDFKGLRTNFKSDPLDVLAGCLRASFRAPDGQEFDISDLSAIETRVGAWESGCKKLLQIFVDGKCPYLTFACKLYNKNYDDLKAAYDAKDPAAKEMRQNAKPAILGAIFRLGGGEEQQTEDGDTIRTGLWGYAQSLGIEMTKELAHSSVKIFREEYPEIVQFWYDLENASIKCVKTGKPQTVGFARFELLDDVLKLVLPSGRSIHYLHPTIEDRPWFEGTKKTLMYWGSDQKAHVFTRIPTHGGKICENLTQAIARDILAEAMLRADKRGILIRLHAHDEIAASRKIGSTPGLKELVDCMREPIDWAPGLPLDAAGFSSVYYKKE